MGGKSYQLGKCARKIDPKLRMVANGETQVNIVRAENCKSLTVAPSVDVTPALQTSAEVIESLPAAEPPPRGVIATPSSEILVNVFIATDSLQKLPADVVTETGRVGSLATATVPLSKLPQIADMASVRSITTGSQLKDPDPAIAPAPMPEPSHTTRQVPGVEVHRNGKDVLVGIIDVQGFDFAHPDFLDDNGQTRFEAIWDQGAEHDSTSPRNYGRVIDKKLMNDAIAAAPDVHAPAVELEPQSQRIPKSHGTHVASIAAGKWGVAPAARIAAVLVSMGDEDTDRRRSFYDSTRLAHAVEYLLALGEQLKLPVSINVSLGTNGDAHDSSAPINRWIDSLLITHGRCVCVAAGNAGQDKAESAQDMGWVMGRIHTSGQVKAKGLDVDIVWTVAGSGGRDYSENELELWFSPQDQFAVSVRTPPGEWIGPVEPARVHREPTARRRHLHQHLQRALPRGQRLQLHRGLSQPELQGRSHRWRVSGELDCAATRSRRSRRAIRRLDRARRSARAASEPGVPLRAGLSLLLRERSNVDRSSISHAGLRSCA